MYLKALCIDPTGSCDAFESWGEQTLTMLLFSDTDSGEGIGKSYSIRALRERFSQSLTELSTLARESIFVSKAATLRKSKSLQKSGLFEKRPGEVGENSLKAA